MCFIHAYNCCYMRALIWRHALTGCCSLPVLFENRHMQVWGSPSFKWPHCCCSCTNSASFSSPSTAVDAPCDVAIAITSLGGGWSTLLQPQPQSQMKKKKWITTTIIIIVIERALISKRLWGDSGRWQLAAVFALTLGTTGISVGFNFLGRDFYNALASTFTTTF